MCKKRTGLFLLIAIFFLSAYITTVSAKQSIATNIIHELGARDTVPSNDTAESKVFEAVEEEAYFPGGLEGWRSFLIQNLNASTPADKGAPAGTYTIYVQFIVGKDGKIYDIKPLTKHGYGMEAEVVRILKKSPDWVPAVQHGKNVNAYRKQPVTFQVIEEKKKKRNRDN